MIARATALELRPSQTIDDPSSVLSRLRGFLSPKKPPTKPPALLHGPLPPLRTCKPVEFEQVFNYLDADGDGKISPTELSGCLRAVGEELSPEEAAAVVESTDSDGDGLLGMEDFVRLVAVESEEEKGRSLRAAFEMYGMDGQDCITPNSLRRTLRRLGEKKSVEECERMIQRFDLNGDGVLSFDEFRVMMV